MRGRLLCGLMLIALIMVTMYFKLVMIHPDLISGFITLIAVIITHIMNSAEDILAALFRIGESPKPVTPTPPLKTPATAPGSTPGAQT